MTPPIDIRPDHLETVRAILREHLPRGVEAWVFGSRADWTTKDSSDLDLALEGDGPLDPGIVMALELAFQESLLPFSVDVVDLRRVDEGFRRIVLRNRAVLLSDSGVGPAGAPDEFQEHGREWTDAHWGDVAALEYGRALRGYRESRGPCRVYGTNGPIGWHSEPLCRHPTVIVGRKGAYRGVHYAPDPAYVIDTAFYLKPKRPMDVRWAYYALLTNDINGLDAGSAIPSTRREDFYSLPVRLPSPSEQNAIAGVLGALDDRIDLNRRMNETLEAMARALFKSWFVDFDPVQAKMEGRDPGLPQEIAEVFPDRLVESELGEIPEGWEVSEIGKEVDVVGGATPRTNEPAYWSGGRHHWVTPRDLSKLVSPVLLETDRKITDAGVGKISSGLLPVGTVLLSSRAPIGYLAVAAVPTAMNQGFIAMICRKRLSDLYVLFWCYENLDHIKGISGGSTFAEISKRVFRPIPVIVPPKRVLEAYEGVSRSLYDPIVSNTRKSALLGTLRDTLLTKFVSGEIRLPATLVDRYGKAPTTLAT